MSEIYSDENTCAFRQFCEGRADDIMALRNQLREAEMMANRYKAYVHHWQDCSFYKDWGACSCGLFALLSGRGEGRSTIIRKVLDDNRDILEALGDE